MIPRGKEAAALALHRFGFGPGFGVEAGRYSIAAIAGDPRGAVLSDMDRPNAGLILSDLPSAAQAARAVSDFRAEEQAKKKLAQRTQKDAEAKGQPASMNGPTTAMLAAAPSAAKPQQNKEPPLPQRLFQDEASERIGVAVVAPIGFVERLVWFWSNHFCISADKEIAMAGAYEREAIRSHVLGHFADLLQAAESHPAMLFNLDNVQSMGADSINGINRDRGLNENLAREILELHTLGVHGGYSQADVTSFANVLTGWTWVDPADPERGGEFLFNKRLHQPGGQSVLGKWYADGGSEQGRAVLADLARHPATAQHIAQKLGRHFVADEPPPSLVGKLAKTFRDTDGNLKELAKTLVTAEESWTPARGKLKPPAEWMIGVLRLSDARLAGTQPPTIGRLLNFQAVLGQPLWRPPAPNGYADTDGAWIDGVPRRLDVANQFAGQLRADADPLDLLDRSLGPLASDGTRRTVERAESRAQAFALLAMAPEYLRR